MNKHYLSTIILTYLDDKKSDESAIKAAKACQAEYDSRAMGPLELRDFYDCARDYPVLDTLGLTVVAEAKKVYP